MKRLLLALLVLFVLSACALPAAVTSTPVVMNQGQAPADTAAPTAEPLPVENTPVPTATAIPEPTATPTPVPPPARWYWSVDSATAKVIAVNQFGERHEIGSLEQADSLNSDSVTIDNERALLFLDRDNRLRIYLLTPDGMEKVALPTDPFYFDTEFAQSSRAVIHVYGDSVVFSYVTEMSSNLMPDTGPIFLLDLNALTAKLIDKTVSRDAYGNNNYWFHASEDGRILRYLNGSRQTMDIRELDMVSGEARAIFSTSGSSYNMHSSPQGNLWFLHDTDTIWDVSGNQMDFPDESLAFWPLDDSKGAVFQRECADNCKIKIVTPFGDDAELDYVLPWGIESGYFNSLVSQLLPDQSLLFAAQPYLFLSTEPSILQEYPDLLDDDRPVFRLTPDGQARLVGVTAGGISPDLRFMLLKSPDQTSFFIYDAIADRTLYDDMPINPDLEDYLTDVKYFDAGILVNLSAAVPDTKHSEYKVYYHAYHYETAAARAWEDENAEINLCTDFLEDGSVVCWYSRPDYQSVDLFRFDPATDIKTPLLEDVWLIDFR